MGVVSDGMLSVCDDLCVEIDDEKLRRYKHVFKDIFTKMGQAAHYEMMMHLIAAESK